MARKAPSIGSILAAVLQQYVLHTAALPAPGDAAATTTLTSVWSSTTTSATTITNPFGPSFELTTIFTETATLYDPRPTLPLSLLFPATPVAAAAVKPYTLVQTAVSTRTTEVRVTLLGGGTFADPASPSVQTSRQTNVYTVPSTWLLWPSAAADATARQADRDMPAGTGLDAVPCGGGGACVGRGDDGNRQAGVETGGAGTAAAAAGQTATADAECAAKGLDTACQGQCRWREGVWWCYRMYYSDWGGPMQMGRACWGANGTYEQLVKPCAAADLRVGCSACGGRDYSWGAQTWL